MARVDSALYHQKGGGLFRILGEMTAKTQEKYPGRPIVKLGVGDVTLPLVPAILEALHAAVDEQGVKASFHGYTGNVKKLVDGIVEKDYAQRGVTISPKEIYVTDGSSAEIYNITDIFASDSEVLVPDPAYPAYVDVNSMLGRKIHYVPCLEENGFIPQPPDYKVDIVYLCSPNNPTGATMTKDDLAKWVAYAKANGAVIVMDSAYESFVMDESLPKTIYEVEGARECAVEIRSFSKTAGFTGMRCSYIVIPTDVMIDADDGKKVSLRSMYVKKRGVRSCNPSYVVQMGAAGYYTEAGHAQCMENTRYYLNNGKVVRKVLQEAGVPCIGGDNSPYIWMKCPGGMGSWEFLEILLDRYGVVMTPGAGFGPSGEGFMRISCFGDAGETKRGIEYVAALCKEIEGK